VCGVRTVAAADVARLNALSRRSPRLSWKAMRASCAPSWGAQDTCCWPRRRTCGTCRHVDVVSPPGSLTSSVLRDPPQAHVQWLQSSLVESRGEGMQLRGACAQAERSVALLSSDLASSRESAEALRRDLRALQAQGEGRAREQDVSARDLRKELRDADETIGCAPTPTTQVQAWPHEKVKYVGKFEHHNALIFLFQPRYNAV